MTPEEQRVIDAAIAWRKKAGLREVTELTIAVERLHEARARAEK